MVLNMPEGKEAAEREGKVGSPDNRALPCGSVEWDPAAQSAAFGPDE